MKLLLNLDLSLGAPLNISDLPLNIDARTGYLDLAQRSDLELPQVLVRELCPLWKQLFVLIAKVVGEPLPFKQLEDPLVAFVFEDSNLVPDVLFELLFFGAFDSQGALILFSAFSSKHLHIDDSPVDARRAGQAGVAHVARLLAEDRSKQLLFSGQLGLAL